MQESRGTCAEKALIFVVPCRAVEHGAGGGEQFAQLDNVQGPVCPGTARGQR